MKKFIEDLTDSKYQVHMSEKEMKKGIKTLFPMPKNFYDDLFECEVSFYQYPQETILDGNLYIAPSFDYDTSYSVCLNEEFNLELVSSLSVGGASVAFYKKEDPNKPALFIYEYYETSEIWLIFIP